MSLYFQGWTTHFTGWGALPTPDTIPQGGAGYPVYVKRPKTKPLDQVVSEWIEADARAMYAQIVATAPKAMKKAAAQIVKPLATKQRAIPAVDTVDWDRVQADADRVMALLALWRSSEDDMEAEDELLLLMH